MRPRAGRARGRGAAARRGWDSASRAAPLPRGRARAAGEPGATQTPQAPAGGVGARRGLLRGPGEWSNLTAGARRRRAAGNGGGGGGAGRHREAWAVTRAPERGSDGSGRPAAPRAAGYLGYELITTWKLKELRIHISRAEAWACCDSPVPCHNVKMQFRQQQHRDRAH